MIAVGSAEWLQRTSFSADSAIAELCGRLACLTAWLRRSASLLVLPDEHREALADAFTDVPIQAPTRDAWQPQFAWLKVASLAEFLGHRELARSLVEAPVSHAARDSELLALCEGQRGRIARTSGHLDDAAEHFADAKRRTKPLPKRDAWTRALCGLANVHIDRGNFPAAERCLRRALTAGPQVAAPTRVQPWMGLAMVRRKRVELVDATLCAWNAFDLIAEGTPH
jgi:tetratricopeptide (TPR) repeat protein